MDKLRTPIYDALPFWTIKDCARVLHLTDLDTVRRRLRQLGVKGRGTKPKLFVPSEVIQAVLDSE